MGERTDGPIITPQGLRCAANGRRCKHLGVNDWHYFYCAAQPVEGQVYPWRGAGVQLRSACLEVPAACPITAPPADSAPTP